MKKKNLMTTLLLALGFLIVTFTQLVAQEKENTFSELSEFMEKYEEKCPDVASGFYSLHDSIVNKDGVLDRKTKEFVALGIAVSQRCKYCIYFHTAAAMKHGASEEEILEAASVAVYMGGGPAYSHIKYVFDAMEELLAIKESQNAEK